MYHTETSEETVALGRTLASRLKPGDVVAFYGELGAGKTTMIKGIAAGLGVADVVKSPSFVIVTEYRGKIGTHNEDVDEQGVRTIDNRQSEIGNGLNCQGPALSEPRREKRFLDSPGSLGMTGRAASRTGRQERQGSDEESKRLPSPLPPPSRGREQREGVPVYHIDLYRLGLGVESRESRVESRMSGEEIEGIGLDSYLDGNGVCLIEWAERAEEILPVTAIRVRMSVEGSGRRIEITGLRVPL